MAFIPHTKQASRDVRRRLVIVSLGTFCRRGWFPEPGFCVGCPALLGGEGFFDARNGRAQCGEYLCGLSLYIGSEGSEALNCDYKVVEAANADEAVTVLSHKETVIDLVFTDIEMPGALDGFGLAQWVREDRTGLDVILAGTLPRTLETAKKLCEEGPIPKPYDAQI